MKAHKISDSVYCLHADIEAPDLFEGIWPIPQGVSLNSYMVKGDKIALIDLIRDWGGAPKQLEEAMSDVGIRFDQVDYLILNHLEPDHTGWLREFRQKSPKAEIISTAKGINLVKSFYKIEDGLRAVKDGETLDLGKGKVLTFREAPNIHWPETMVTWDGESGTLFPCDAFGSYRALGDRIFDDEFSPAEHEVFEKECLRYYANIVASFSVFVVKAVEKLAGLDIKCIAPSHGIVWRKSPKTIIDRYLKYASYAKGPAEKEIAIVWGSMYGNTKQGVDAVARGIESEGVPYSLHRIPDESVSFALADVYKSSGLVIAMPTYEYAMFPPMSNVLDIFRRKHITGKTVLRIGSWGWVGGAKKDYEAAIEPLKWTSLESKEWAGAPTEEEVLALEEKGRELARAVKLLA
ncbi:metallo-beta-lactamase family protein [Treponema primitia ZAS-2]|uniref:Metallo-beta-lactamase family protein n=1 Tax=Treponema primitia (strain ATCC BAA-887 / DSM 12427 / ZAS-2) TaxID=545694 RepID=F5YK57_TREPZ|nr:FprA family A-type flavoprotein [Treponema primitia]AEF83875.1 metallo-beta-lactamase family protein [Treponema primitia ZAS-2]